ncbi:response regulator [Pyxidicoccus fallax]|uniref:Response regulator n=2 Tax=Pyxidicoccus fallax TaxID=394095 RepID=A0A848LPD1_9BACT|nr:response regulator [Pyxidicoccus fallax]NMO19529.1 response regulator [Pyxidicoccus fallax]NPC82780.1 response regulator [Pyxidicoccus fallax]
MVVEDDAEIREALLEILEENGCDAVGAVNGERALAYLRSTDSLPCLILLDLMMPIMDGHAFREAQLQDPVLSRIPVVVVSAYRDVQTNAEKLNAATFIRKPPRIEELVSAIEQHC